MILSSDDKKNHYLSNNWYHAAYHVHDLKNRWDQTKHYKWEFYAIHNSHVITDEAYKQGMMVIPCVRGT